MNKWRNRNVVILELGINTIFDEQMDPFLGIIPKSLQTKISINCF